MPDEGKVEWAKNVRAGYLDQHAVLEKGMTIRTCFHLHLIRFYRKNSEMNEISVIAWNGTRKR